MDEYIKREALVHRLKSPYLFNITQRIFDIISEIPADDVAPIEALERLRDEMCAQDLITMEGLRRLNTLIWKYTTVHIEALPAADVAPVVRCKDCKHKGWVQEPCHGKSVDYCKVWDCTLRNLETTFCSYGERKDGGDG